MSLSQRRSLEKGSAMWILRHMGQETVPSDASRRRSMHARWPPWLHGRLRTSVRSPAMGSRQIMHASVLSRRPACLSSHASQTEAQFASTRTRVSVETSAPRARSARAIRRSSAVCAFCARSTRESASTGAAPASTLTPPCAATAALTASRSAFACCFSFHSFCRKKSSRARFWAATESGGAAAPPTFRLQWIAHKSPLLAFPLLTRATGSSHGFDFRAFMNPALP
mmetsp:Transcript_645/g.2355  ORF Transcript_645/g.2355 Transcript_645/m.2355 type:complete len:226 (-) Transcript_645:329-1006(-)